MIFCFDEPNTPLPGDRVLGMRVDAAGERLMGYVAPRGVGPSGWASDYMFHQPDLERALRAGLARSGAGAGDRAADGLYRLLRHEHRQHRADPLDGAERAFLTKAFTSSC